MQPENARTEEAKMWLSKAQDDLRSGKIIFDNDQSLQGVVLFHCQQAIEKTLKAFPAFHNFAFRKTHHLGELGHQCVQIEPSFEPLLRKAYPLTVFAWAFRYPEDPEEPVSGDAASALSLAHDVFEMVLRKLPEEAGS